MVLGKLPVPGRPTLWMTVEQGPTALAVGAGGGCLDFFSLIYPISILSPSLWETARYRLKYCLKGPLSPKQPTNQPQPLAHYSDDPRGDWKTYTLHWQTTAVRQLTFCNGRSAHKKEALRMRQACVNGPCRPLAWYLFSGIGVGRVVRRCWVNFQVLLIWIIAGQGPVALAVGAGGRFDIFFSHLSFLSSFSLSFGDGPI